MTGFIENINKQAKTNTLFRHVLETGNYTQIVIMSIPPQGEIGEETHTDTDQVLYVVEGQGKTILNDEEKDFNKDDIILVNAGTKHNFVNTGQNDLKIITTYSPPHHPPGTIHKTKEEAQKANY